MLLTLGGQLNAQSDQLNLEENQGTRMEDAYPTKFLNREIQLYSYYRLDSEEKNEILLTPTFEYGIFRNAELELSAPFKMGNADKANSGDIRLGLLYNLNTENIFMPAFAVVGKAIFPTGIESSGFDYSFKGIFSKSIFRSILGRIHFNFEYIINQDPKKEPANGEIKTERDQRFILIAGYSGRLGRSSVILVNYVYEEKRLITKEQQVIELGWRKQLAPRTVISAGAGFGISTDAPKFQINIGFQRNI